MKNGFTTKQSKMTAHKFFTTCLTPILILLLASFALTPVLADTIPPDIDSTSPSHNAINVSLDPPITITFTEQISDSSLQQLGIRITANETGDGDDFKTPQFTLAELLNSGLATKTESNPNGKHQITLDTNLGLPAKADITVELFLDNLRDLAGNAMAAPTHRTYSFQTSAAPAVDAQTGNFYVDPAAGNDTSGNGSLSNPWKTITYALTQIVSTVDNPSIINLNPGIYSTLSGETFPIALESHVGLVGDNESNTIIDGAGADIGLLRGNDVDGVTVSNLAIINTDGNSTGNQSAIYLTADSKLTLFRVRFSHHQNHLHGAAVRAENSAVTLIQNWFLGNSAQSGGAIYLKQCDLLIRSNHFDANQSLDS